MSSQDIHDYYRGFGVERWLAKPMDGPFVYKPSIPEVEERKQEVVWKKPDPQADRDWWLDSDFADGTSVREVLEKIEEEGNDIFPELYKSVKEMTESERKPIIPLWDGRKPPYEPHDAGLKRTLRDMLGDGDWDHLRVYVDGRSEEGGSKVEWATANQPVFYSQAEKAESETRAAQVGGTHYSDLSIQPWDAMRAWFTPAEYASYHIGTVIGYLSRHRRKGGLSDIKKAHHHLSELIRYFEEEEEYE
jgi:hypothetical protein